VDPDHGPGDDRQGIAAGLLHARLPDREVRRRRIGPGERTDELGQPGDSGW
jgi:hypothetical protein